MNYENDEFHWINFAPLRVYIKETRQHIYLQTVGYYYKGEVFRSTPLYPGIMVGNYGTIYDLRGFKIEPRLSDYGYHTVCVFSAKYGRTKVVPVHRLVMIAHDFIENYEEMEVNHKNGDKTFNYFNPYDREGCNLEWSTRKENARHALITGLHPLKYPEELIRSLLQLMREGYSPTQAIDTIGADYDRNGLIHLLSHILHRGAYSWISKDYPDVLNMAKSGSPKYNLSDEDVHLICRMMINHATIDEIQSAVNLGDRTRSAINALLLKLRHNEIGLYKHITSQYFDSQQSIPSVKRTVTPGVYLKKYSEEFLRGVLDKLRIGYSREQAVEAMGYEYTPQVCATLSQMLRGNRFEYITKDYPDVMEKNKPHHFAFSDEDIRKMCQMMINGYTVDDIMAAFDFSGFSRLRVRAFLGKLRRNEHTKYVHITGQYFSKNADQN